MTLVPSMMQPVPRFPALVVELEGGRAETPTVTFK